MTTRLTAVGIWVLRLIPAVIMLQTLWYKFSGAEESVYIFSSLHMEPWGRIGIGLLELLASGLILYPKTTGIGAILAIGIMSGAIYFHLTTLGVVVMNDKGLLFIYALMVLVSSMALLLMFRKDVFHLLPLHF